MKSNCCSTNVKVLAVFSLLLCTTFGVGQTVSLSSAIGPPTTETLVSGSAFEPYAVVDILFDATALAVANADTGGSFSGVSLTVPASALPGSHVIKAVPRGGGDSAQAPFTVRTNWPMYHFDLNHSGYNKYENLLGPSTVGGLQVKWIFHLGGDACSGPTIVDGVAYFASWDANLYAVDAGTGVKLWSYYTGQLMCSSPAVVDGVVYAGLYNTNFIAVNAKTGKKKWASAYTLGVACSPAVVGGLVYFSAGDGNIYALDANTGATVWTYPTGAYYLWSSPAVVDGVVYVGSHDGNLYALNAATGAKLWSYATGDIAFDSPTVSNGVVYINGPANLFALDAATGALLWSYPMAGTGGAVPAVAGGVVYVGSADGYVYALDASTSALKWKQSVGSAYLVTVANEVVYVGSTDHNIYALDATTGQKLWTYTTPNIVGGHGGPAIVDGVLYVASGSNSGDNNVYAFYLPAIVSLSSTSMTFSTQLVGTTSAVQSVTLSNPGAQPVTIASIVASGDFQQANKCPAKLKAGASCTIKVAFSPHSSGTKTGTVTITDSAAGSPQTIALAGEGTAVLLSSGLLDFGDQKVGTSSQPQTVRMTNVSKDPIHISAAGIAGANFSDFTEQTTCGSQLPGGASCTFSLTFTPKGKGSRSAHLAIADNGGASPQEVNLTGNGI
jgi:outer membrane protein assembly factor BamB